MYRLEKISRKFSVCLNCLTGFVLKALLSLVLTLFLHSGLFSESKKQTQVSFLLRRKGESSQYSQWEVGLCTVVPVLLSWWHLQDRFKSFNVVHPLSDWNFFVCRCQLGDTRSDYKMQEELVNMQQRKHLMNTNVQRCSGWGGNVWKEIEQTCQILRSHCVEILTPIHDVLYTLLQMKPHIYSSLRHHQLYLFTKQAIGKIVP